MALRGAAGVDSQLREWGELLGGLCTERAEGGVARISWTVVHNAADTSDARHYHRAHGQPGPASDEYERHLDVLSEATSTHDEFVTVTLSTGTARRRRSLDERAKSDYVTATIEQTQVVARELTARATGPGDRRRRWR